MLRQVAAIVMLVWMHLILRCDLMDRLVTTQRFQRHVDFEQVCKLLAFRHSRIPSKVWDTPQMAAQLSESTSFSRVTLWSGGSCTLPHAENSVSLQPEMQGGTQDELTSSDSNRFAGNHGWLDVLFPFHRQQDLSTRP